MSPQPRLLDLFCGAGGAAKGYQRAGFYVVGVDINPQPRYCGDEFYQADAMTFPLEGFEAIHASPPCQAYTRARALRGREHPRLLRPIHDRLVKQEAPWIIENVVGAPMHVEAMLCGLMFGLQTYRHRIFDSSFGLPLILHPPHHARPVKMGRAPQRDTDIISVVGHFSGVAAGRKAMGIDWMTQKELAESIPPAYTEWIGKHLLAEIAVESAGSGGPR